MNGIPSLGHATFICTMLRALELFTYQGCDGYVIVHARVFTVKTFVHFHSANPFMIDRYFFFVFEEKT